MPQLDVNASFYDTMVANQVFDVVQVTPGTDGEGSRLDVEVTVRGVVGSVQPASSRDLLRTPDLERTEDAVTVKTATRLRSGWRVVLKSGNTYTVRNVRDWTDFGAGFVSAVCELRDIQETQPS